jgi:hypothetical protein
LPVDGGAAGCPGASPECASAWSPACAACHCLIDVTIAAVPGPDSAAVCSRALAVQPSAGATCIPASTGSTRWASRSRVCFGSIDTCQNKKRSLKKIPQSQPYLPTSKPHRGNSSITHLLRTRGSFWTLEISKSRRAVSTSAVPVSPKTAALYEECRFDPFVHSGLGDLFPTRQERPPGGLQ